ncbi:MAG: hypothetical protein VW397_02710 [Candidatus Margulisiibacteriota bacterium]
MLSKANQGPNTSAVGEVSQKDNRQNSNNFNEVGQTINPQQAQTLSETLSGIDLNFKADTTDATTLHDSKASGITQNTQLDDKINDLSNKVAKGGFSYSDLSNLTSLIESERKDTNENPISKLKTAIDKSLKEVDTTTDENKNLIKNLTNELSEIKNERNTGKTSRLEARDEAIAGRVEKQESRVETLLYKISNAKLSPDDDLSPLMEKVNEGLPDGQTLEQFFGKDESQLTEQITNRLNVIKSLDDSNHSVTLPDLKSSKLLRTRVSTAFGMTTSKVTVGILKEGLNKAETAGTKKSMILEYCQIKKNEKTGNFLESLNHLRKSDKLTDEDKDLVQELQNEITKELFNPKDIKSINEELPQLKDKYEENKSELSQARDDLNSLKRNLNATGQRFSAAKSRLLEKAGEIIEDASISKEEKKALREGLDLAKDIDEFSKLNSEDMEFKNLKKTCLELQTSLKKASTDFNENKNRLEDKISLLEKQIESVQTTPEDAYKSPSFDENQAIKQTTHGKNMIKKYGITINLSFATSKNMAELFGQQFTPDVFKGYFGHE